jgi:hypothetical protein
MGAATVTGDPLDHVPEIAIPHVRAAAAWRLLELEGRGERTLESWVDVLEAALERRSKPGPAAAAEEVLTEDGKPPRFKGKVDMWTRDQAEDEVRPAALYLGTSRRTTSEDSRTDLALVILEAAARMEPPWTELLEAGSSHPAEPVQWTAGRLTKIAGAVAAQGAQPPGGAKAAGVGRSRTRTSTGEGRPQDIHRRRPAPGCSGGDPS